MQQLNKGHTQDRDYSAICSVINLILIENYGLILIENYCFL